MALVIIYAVLSRLILSRNLRLKIWIRISQIQDHFMKVFHKTVLFFKGWLPLVQIIDHQQKVSMLWNWIIENKSRLLPCWENSEYFEENLGKLRKIRFNIDWVYDQISYILLSAARSNCEVENMRNQHYLLAAVRFVKKWRKILEEKESADKSWTKH